MPSYASPTDLWTLSAPPLGCFQDGRLCRGSWSAPEKTGTGLGTLALDTGDASRNGSNPRDAYAVRVEVLQVGELPVQGEPSFVGLPRLRVRLADDAAWSPSQVPDASGRVQVIDAPVPLSYSRTGLASTGGGFTLQLANGGPGAAVTFGSGNAALLVAPRKGGLSFKIVVGTALQARLDLQTGLIVLTVGSATTATQAAAYFVGAGLPVEVTAGGTGASVVQAAATQALPFVAFAVGDVWTFTTNPSPDVLAALLVSSDFTQGYLRDSNNSGGGPLADPLVAYGSALVGCVTDLARYRLYQRSGLSKQDDQDYRPIEAMKWLDQLANGRIQPSVQEAGAHRSFAMLVSQPDPLANTFPI